MLPAASTLRPALPRGLGWAAGMVVSAWLAACAAPPAAPPSPGVPIPAQWNGAAPDDAAPAVELRAWWRAFHDPALEALVEQALAGNADLAAATARLRAARALAQASDAAWRPQLALAAGPQASADGRNGYFQAGFDASWELDLFGAGAASRSMAAAELGAARAEAQAARVSLVAEVVRTYLELRQAEREAAILVRQAELGTERERLLKIQLDARQVAADDVLAGTAAAAAARAAPAEALAQAARCRDRLRVLLGDWQAPLPPPATESDPVAMARLGVPPAPADLVRTRPEIQLAEQEVLKAASAAGIARADLQPQFSLVGLLGVVAGVSGVDAGTRHGLVSAGPVLRLPLLDAGRRRAAVEARDAELEAAVAHYRQAVLEGLAEAQSALAQWRLSAARVVAAAQAEAAWTRRESAAAMRAQLHLGDGLQLAEARGARLQARLALAQAQLGEQLAFVAFFKALGGAPLPGAEAGP